MISNRLLKYVHSASTGWFIASCVFLTIVALRQAGLGWWVIFSLSGHSTALILFLTLVYSFAIFRGVSRSQKIELEHPLTCSSIYLIFYDIAPFLGAIASLSNTSFTRNSFDLMITAATGTLCSTFLAWIIIDPVVSMIEMLLPSSRAWRKKRIIETKQLQRQIQQDNERLMAEIAETESKNRKQRQIELKDTAVDLARLLAAHKIGCKNIEEQAVEIGSQAWRLGGIECMRQLCEMAGNAYLQKYMEPADVNHICIWWDGIGSWRKKTAYEEFVKNRR